MFEYLADLLQFWHDMVDVFPDFTAIFFMKIGYKMFKYGDLRGRP